jgi:hypothetical protein
MNEICDVTHIAGWTKAGGTEAGGTKVFGVTLYGDEAPSYFHS